ncbi:hypothetical protein EUGRSUZ_C00547 [Eucalyptus grandis]|uniref:Uncharacterized protein n=2 Tax=Eucalyptus grandis TaxID=71139 RepID=A0ACC3LAI8_EUCGR|nr:hypothetical protein EUGRSUZ_C00547 [Eucalyptus grandis]
MPTDQKMITRAIAFQVSRKSTKKKILSRTYYPKTSRSYQKAPLPSVIIWHNTSIKQNWQTPHSPLLKENGENMNFVNQRMNTESQNKFDPWRSMYKYHPLAVCI